MDLIGENRILVKEGLKATEPYTECRDGIPDPCLRTGRKRDQILPYRVCTGTVHQRWRKTDTAKRSLNLLLRKDRAKADVMAAELKTLNDERKDMTQTGAEEAIEWIEKRAEARIKSWLSIFRTAMKAWPGSSPGVSGNATTNRCSF